MIFNQPKNINIVVLAYSRFN